MSVLLFFVVVNLKTRARGCRRTFRVPVVNGREVDLQRLYHVVAAQLGGYRRVSVRIRIVDPSLFLRYF